MTECHGGYDQNEFDLLDYLIDHNPMEFAATIIQLSEKFKIKFPIIEGC